MCDGETAKPGYRPPSPPTASANDTPDNTQTTKQKRYRMDKIAWVNPDEEANPTTMSIRSLVALLDNIVLSAQDRLKPHQIQGRTSVIISHYLSHNP